MAQRVAQMDNESIEIGREASRGRRIAGPLELGDEGREPLLSVALVLGLVERLPIGPAYPLALLLGQLRDQVARPVNGAILAIGGRPALLDRLDQSGGAVGDDEHRRPEPAGDQVPCEGEPVLVGLAHPEADADEDPLTLLGEAPGAKDALLRALRPDIEEDRVENSATSPTP